MAHGDGLGLLEMGVPGNDDVYMMRSPLKENRKKSFNAGTDPEKSVPQEKAHRNRNLVVPAPPCMELGPGGTKQFDEPALNVHMNIFELLGRKKRSRGDLIPYPDEPFLYPAQLFSGKKPHSAEHARMGKTALDVIECKRPVEVERLGEFLDDLRGIFRKTSLPHDQYPFRDMFLQRRTQPLSTGDPQQSGERIVFRKSPAG